jgi:hypothetical protein
MISRATTFQKVGFGAIKSLRKKIISIIFLVKYKIKKTGNLIYERR